MRKSFIRSVWLMLTLSIMSGATLTLAWLSLVALNGDGMVLIDFNFYGENLFETIMLFLGVLGLFSWVIVLREEFVRGDDVRVEVKKGFYDE